VADSCLKASSSLSEVRRPRPPARAAIDAQPEFDVEMGCESCSTSSGSKADNGGRLEECADRASLLRGRQPGGMPGSHVVQQKTPVRSMLKLIVPLPSSKSAVSSADCQAPLGWKRGVVPVRLLRLREGISAPLVVFAQLLQPASLRALRLRNGAWTDPASSTTLEVRAHCILGGKRVRKSWQPLHSATCTAPMAGLAVYAPSLLVRLLQHAKSLSCSLRPLVVQGQCQHPGPTVHPP
jgi:hypothetical protein